MFKVMRIICFCLILLLWNQIESSTIDEKKLNNYFHTNINHGLQEEIANKNLNEKNSLDEELKALKGYIKKITTAKKQHLKNYNFWYFRQG